MFQCLSFCRDIIFLIFKKHNETNQAGNQQRSHLGKNEKLVCGCCHHSVFGKLVIGKGFQSLQHILLDVINVALNIWTKCKSCSWPVLMNKMRYFILLKHKV